MRVKASNKDWHSGVARYRVLVLDPNDGAALRPRVRGISLNREEVRQAGGGAASVDDVYVPPTAVARRAS